MRTNQGVVLLFCAVGLIACGAEISRLRSGEYRSSSAMVGTPLEGSTLSLDLEARSARLKLSDGSQVELTLSAVEEADWERGCPTNYSAVRVETFGIAPAPLKVAGLTLARPRLTSGGVEEAREAELHGEDPQGTLHKFIYNAAQ
jgi:hypothetical protein